MNEDKRLTTYACKCLHIYIYTIPVCYLHIFVRAFGYSSTIYQYVCLLMFNLCIYVYFCLFTYFSKFYASRYLLGWLAS